VLARRDFRLLFFAQCASWIGDAVIPVAIAFAVLDLTGSAAALGLVLAARELPLVLFLLAGGVVGDRLPRRPIMVSADIARAAAQGAAAILLLGGWVEVWHLVVLQAVNGMATAAFNPASTALLPALVPAGEVQAANALRGTAFSLTTIVGPVLSGLLVVSFGSGGAFVIDAASFAASGVLLSAIRAEGRVAPATTRLLADLKHGWSAFISRDWCVAFVVAAAFINLFNAAFTVLGPIVASRDLGGAAAWGFIAAALGAGSVAGGLAAIRLRVARPLVLAGLALTLFAVPLVLLALAAPVAVVAAGALVAGVALITANTLWESTLQRLVPDEVLARVSAYDWIGSLGLLPIGYVVVGPLSVALGLEATLLLSAGGVLLTGLAPLAVTSVRQMRFED
jgi:MFS family permease